MRPRLDQRLNEGLEIWRRLTLVSAPAGFGKTTCVSAWLNALDWPIAWLSLDRVDKQAAVSLSVVLAGRDLKNLTKKTS